jgi:hypothetical protein
MPQKAAGIRVEPPVSDPKPAGVRRAAIAAPVPPLDPPGTRLMSYGFLAKREVRRRYAHRHLVHVCLTQQDCTSAE